MCGTCLSSMVFTDKQSFTSISGIQLGVRVPPGVREDMLGVRKIKKKIYTKQVQLSHYKIRTTLINL